MEVYWQRRMRFATKTGLAARCGDSGKRRSMTQGMQMRLTAIRGFLCLLVSAGTGVDIANAQQLEKALKLWTNTAAERVEGQLAQFSIANGELMFRELLHECFADEVRAKIAEIDFSKSYFEENNETKLGFVNLVCKDKRKCFDEKFGSKVWLAAQRCTRHKKMNEVHNRKNDEAFLSGRTVPVAQEIFRLLKAQ
jgi:hypothetical protein